MEQFEDSKQYKIEEELAKCKQYLVDTDFEIIKVSEGASSLVKCAVVVAKRAEARIRINQIERELEKLKEAAHE